MVLTVAFHVGVRALLVDMDPMEVCLVVVRALLVDMVLTVAFHVVARTILVDMVLTEVFHAEELIIRYSNLDAITKHVFQYF